MADVPVKGRHRPAGDGYEDTAFRGQKRSCVRQQLAWLVDMLEHLRTDRYVRPLRPVVNPPRRFDEIALKELRGRSTLSGDRNGCVA